MYYHYLCHQQGQLSLFYHCWSRGGWIYGSLAVYSSPWQPVSSVALCRSIVSTLSGGLSCPTFRSQQSGALDLLDPPADSILGPRQSSTISFLSGSRRLRCGFPAQQCVCVRSYSFICCIAWAYWGTSGQIFKICERVRGKLAMVTRVVR